MPKIYRMDDEEESKSPLIVNNLNGDDNSFDEDGFQDIDDNLCEVNQQQNPIQMSKQSKKVISIP